MPNQNHLRTIQYFWLVILGSVIASIAYALEIKGLYLTLSPIPALVGAYVVFNQTQDNGYESGYSLSLMFAFALCSIGDVFFALEFVGLDAFYFISYVMFTLAHFCFVYALVYGVPVSNIKTKRHWGQLAIASVLIVCVVEIFVLNRDSFSTAILEISVYGTFLSLTAICAAMRMLHHGFESYFTVLVGSVCFLTSDVFIVITEFTEHLSWSVPIIIPLYYIGISLMVYGFSIGKPYSYTIPVKNGR
ncbi:MAG: lysoplasmalogenase family protein [Bacteroidota bacterium]